MKVFLSYRREDCEPIAVAMAQYLQAIPGLNSVFLDHNTIAIGEDFAKRIRSSLRKSDYCFVLIGEKWAGPKQVDMPARIHNDGDFVRMEVASALAARKTRVIPVLLDGTQMPRAEDLPESLHSLLNLNAFTLRSAHFSADMDDMLDEILAKPARRSGPQSRWQSGILSPGRIFKRLTAGILFAGISLMTIALLNNHFMPGCDHLVCTFNTLMGAENPHHATGGLMMLGGTVFIAFMAGVILPFLPWLGKR